MVNPPMMLVVWGTVIQVVLALVEVVLADPVEKGVVGWLVSLELHHEEMDTVVVVLVFAAVVVVGVVHCL